MSAPCGPLVGLVNLAIWDTTFVSQDSRESNQWNYTEIHLYIIYHWCVANCPKASVCFIERDISPFSVQKLCFNIYVYIYIYIYMYVYSLYEFCYRSYIQRECHSVLAKLHPSRSIGLFLGSARFLGWMPLSVFFCSTLPHLPGCLCPWTFFENIGFNTVLTDPFMSHLATQLGYSAGEFQALQLIVLVAFGVVD